MKTKFTALYLLLLAPLIVIAATGSAMACNSHELVATAKVIESNKPIPVQVKTNPAGTISIDPNEPATAKQDENLAGAKKEGVGATDEFDMEVYQATSLSDTPTRVVSITTWLEERAAKEDATRNMAITNTANKPVTHQDEGMETVGGGWCNSCGCWMRHGCDPNGNCGISHANVCGSDSCVLHPEGPCYNRS